MHKETIKYEQEELIRLDKYLSTVESEFIFSRAQIEKLIADAKVTVNGNIEKKNYKLQLNDVVEIEFKDKEPSEIVPQDIPLSIAYEDEYLAVINKPVGLVVHPGYGNPDGTLANGLAYHFGKQLSKTGGVTRPGIVHRLDKGTSGLIIVAKTDEAHVKLSDMFKNREINKTYRAIIAGKMKEPDGTIENLMARSKKNPVKFIVASEGKTAVTHYKTIERFHYFSYVEIKLETGRTHQIRVHFSHFNCPVIGDKLYSNFEEVASRVPFNYKKRLKHMYEKNLPTQALHAYKLEFVHPITGKDVCVQSELPGYFQSALDWLETNFSIDE